MATILLIVKESSKKLISGIPEYIDFSTNEPSTVFYTLDGSAPDDSSLMAAGNESKTMADRVYLPTDGLSFTIKAKAVTESGSSDVYEKEFYTDVTGIDSARHVGKEGVVVLPYDSTVVESLSIDSSGSKAQSSSKKFEALDMKASSENSKGESTKGGTSLPFVNTLENTSSYYNDNYPKRSSPNDNNIYFDARAGMIILDGRTQEALDSQIVKLVNRPAGSMDNVSSFYDENSQQQQSPVTGNLVRYIYNPNTGDIVFYYYESRESRWIISKQKVDYKQLDIGSSKRARSAGGVVFRWVQDRSMSKIF